jgi:hypothetical protein
MNISKHDIRFLRKLFQSRPRGTGLTVFSLAVLAVGLSFGNLAMAANVLINPGAETGDSTGWTFDADASVASTNGFQYNAGIDYPPTASNILVHSGEYTFKVYQNVVGATRAYQDIAAAPGSQWAASTYALSHTQDYIQTGGSALVQVVFYDSTGTNALAVYGSDILDPQNPYPDPPYFTLLPPVAVDASGWLFLTVTNSYSSDPASELNWNNHITGNLVAPAGTAVVRYQLEFEQTVGAGGSVFFDDCVLDKVVGSDPDIVTAPVAEVVVVGQNASFSVVGSGNTTLFYQWQKNNVNVSGSRVSGALTPTLTVSNVLSADSGNYTVVVTDSNGSIRSVPVALTVLNPAQGNNALGPNAGFETAPLWSPWSPFGGTGLPSTNGTYYQVTNLVNVYDGEYCAQIYDGGRDNGFWVHVPCTPGSVWKAAGHAYITSTVDNLSASNTCRLQVWFQDNSNNHVSPAYESWKIYGLAYTNVYPMMARDTWVYLPVTNMVDGTTDLPTNTVQNFVAPANASVINLQVYYYSPPGGGGTGGSVFWDDMELFQIVPVTNLVAKLSGGHVNLSFSTKGGLLYSVLYKTSLSDASWIVLTNGIAGTGTTVVVSDTPPTNTRFYRVQSY